MFATWCLIVGVLLILIGVSDTWRQRLPVSTSALYLVAGYLLGPQAFGFLGLTLAHNGTAIELLSEVALLVSLFAVGLRLRVQLSDHMWLAPVLMATVAMLITIAVMTGVGVALGFSFGAALLLASVLAPTDPVLASEVQVVNVHDRDRLRFSLTGEGGLNDGAAYPFVMLSLAVLGAQSFDAPGWAWWSAGVAWGIFGGLALGWLLGEGFAKAVVYLRHEHEQAFGMESFLTLGLIALTYGIALTVSTYGFLAVFAAGLAMRHVEHRKSHDQRPRRDKRATAAKDDDAAAGSPAQTSAYMAKAVLDFALDFEKLAELTVMLVVGSLLRVEAFNATSVLVALALIFVARPVAIALAMPGTGLTRAQRRLAAWFGVRGIGSLYYLAFAVTHGAVANRDVADAVLVTIALSVLLHGSSAGPVMALYHRARSRRTARDSA